MKAKELMYGDWVNHNGNPRQIRGAVDFTLAKDFKPIPTTAEILEKNGFVLTYDLYSTDDAIQVAFESKEQFPAIYVSQQGIGKSYMELIYPTGHIIYVHELQHALRLCGLNELADGFTL